MTAKNQTMPLNVCHISLFIIASCFLWLAVSASCENAVVDEDIDCFGFAHDHGQLFLKEVQLVDKHSDPIQLRGISSHGVQWFPDCVTKSALTHLVTTWGINVFRIPVYLETSDNGYLSNPAYFDSYIQQVVEWTGELGIYAIIDFHVLSKGDPNEYLDSKGASTGVAIDFWTKMAGLYKNESHVLYEIANEPNNIDWASVLAYHNSVINAIRTVDSETIIIAGTTTWSQDIHLAAASPVNQPYNVMYTFHFYAASHGFLYDRVASYINTIPIFVSEWGVSAADGNGGYNTEVAQRYLDLFASIDSSILSWTLWSWSDKDETSAILESPTSCASEDWAAVTCPSRYVENYFKSEDFSRMIACNSTGYVPAKSGDDTLFVEEHQWVFWMLGAILLSAFAIGLYQSHLKWKWKLSEKSSFQAVSKGEAKSKPSTAAPFDYESNPYNKSTPTPASPTRSTQQPRRARTPPSQAGAKALHNNTPSKQSRQPVESPSQPHKQQKQVNRSPSRPGQRRQKISQGRGGVQMQKVR